MTISNGRPMVDLEALGRVLVYVRPISLGVGPTASDVPVIGLLCEAGFIVARMQRMRRLIAVRVGLADQCPGVD
jgi:hypothetical protein